MPKYKVGKYRKIDAYIRQRLGPRDIQPLSTSGSIDEELWTILEYYSEVESVGMGLLKRNGITNGLVRKRAFKHFQAYIRQAKTYYNSAKILPSRSSGLLYYYCFLNLAKAALMLKNPSLGGKSINHGLTYKIHNFPLEKQLVHLKQNGVFEKFYEWYFGEKIKLTSFNIKSLLSYCSDIAYQSQIAGARNVKVIPAYFASAVDKTKNTGWGLVGFYDLTEAEKYRKSIQPFFDLFEKIDVPEVTLREIFKISAFEKALLSFFQSKQENPWLGSDVPNILHTRSEAMNSLNKVFQVNYFKEDFDFKLSLPYSVNK